MTMTAGAVLRVAAGVALLAYAVFAFGHGNGVRPLLPAVVGAYLLVRGFIGRDRVSPGRARRDLEDGGPP